MDLGASGHPVAHGGGLLPFPLSRQTRVCSPGIGGKLGFWSIRHLALTEVLAASDLSTSQMEVCERFPALTEALLRQLLPVKCLSAGFRSLSGGVVGVLKLNEQLAKEETKRKSDGAASMDASLGHVEKRPKASILGVEDGSRSPKASLGVEDGSRSLDEDPAANAAGVTLDENLTAPPFFVLSGSYRSTGCASSVR